MTDATEETDAAAEEAKARQVDTNKRCIAAFVVRARRVEAHSLAQDNSRLIAMANGGWSIQTDAGKAPTVIQSFPPEEQVESAAARVRPFLLNEELVYHAKVIKALKAHVADCASQEAKALYAKVKADWKSFDSKSEEHRGFLMQIEDTTTGRVSDMVSDNVLAFAWIYGDTVHADAERLAATEEFGVEHRFKAAVPLIGALMVTTINTLNLVRYLIAAKLLEEPENALEQPVIVTKTLFTYPNTEIFVADVDESRPHPQILDGSLGPEWERFDPARHAPQPQAKE